MTDKLRGVRRQRFSRSASRNIRLTQDDLLIIRHVARHRFLRSTHLIGLLPHRPQKKLIERIGALYHAGYLDRPKAQLDYFGSTGSSPMVYALGHRAADVLNESDAWRYGAAVRRPHIEHALLVADIVLAFEGAVARRTDVTLVDQLTLIDIQVADGRRSSLSLSVQVKSNGHLHRVPIAADAVFGLRYTSGRIDYFFLEADTGTMKINSHDLTQSSLRRKFIGYNAALKADLHVERFGFPNARVLTVTTKLERIAGMLSALNGVVGNKPTGRFLFTDIDSLLQSDPLSMPWHTNGKPTSLSPFSSIA